MDAALGVPWCLCLPSINPSQAIYLTIYLWKIHNPSDLLLAEPITKTTPPSLSPRTRLIFNRAHSSIHSPPSDTLALLRLIVLEATAAFLEALDIATVRVAVHLGHVCAVASILCQRDATVVRFGPVFGDGTSGVFASVGVFSAGGCESDQMDEEDGDGRRSHDGGGRIEVLGRIEFGGEPWPELLLRI